MINPVIAADGHSYEYFAIREWFTRGHQTSPMTGLNLQHDTLTENHILKAQIQNFKDNIEPNTDFGLSVGKMVDHNKNGIGRFTYKNGDVYDGEWVNGLKHGTGEYISAEGDIYIG